MQSEDLAENSVATSYQPILAKLPADLRTQFLEKLTFMNGGALMAKHMSGALGCQLSFWVVVH